MWGEIMTNKIKLLRQYRCLPHALSLPDRLFESTQRRTACASQCPVAMTEVVGNITSSTAHV